MGRGNEDRESSVLVYVYELSKTNKDSFCRVIEDLKVRRLGALPVLTSKNKNWVVRYIGKNIQ